MSTMSALTNVYAFPQEERSKDWTGDKNSIFKTLGASNHTKDARQVDDYYATEPLAIDILCEVEEFDGRIWECACGEGHLSKRLMEHGYQVVSSDLVPRGFGKAHVDFLLCDKPWNGNIITNPPYKHATEFVEKAMELIPEGKKVAMFLKVLFLETKGRKELFEKYPPKSVYISSSRLACAKNGDFSNAQRAVAYAWYVWEKGHTDNTTLHWVN